MARNDCRITGKFGKHLYYLTNEPFERNWRILINLAMTLRPPEKFNLAINGQIRQMPHFPVIQ